MYLINNENVPPKDSKDIIVSFTCIEMSCACIHKRSICHAILQHSAVMQYLQHKHDNEVRLCAYMLGNTFRLVPRAIAEYFASDRSQIPISIHLFIDSIIRMITRTAMSTCVPWLPVSGKSATLLLSARIRGKNKLPHGSKTNLPVFDDIL